MALFRETVGEIVSETFEVEFPRTPAAARRARRWMSGLDLPLPDDQIHDLVLLTNELVTNSVVHARGRGQISVRVEVQADTVRVQVSDPGEGPGGPRVRNARPLDTSGRGLSVVGEVASRWGWQTEDLTNVWFEIDRREPASRV